MSPWSHGCHMEWKQMRVPSLSKTKRRGSWRRRSSDSAEGVVVVASAAGEGDVGADTSGDEHIEEEEEEEVKEETEELRDDCCGLDKQMSGGGNEGMSGDDGELS